MPNEGGSNASSYVEKGCDELGEMHQEPSSNDKLNKKLAENKVTTSVAQVSPPCPDIGNPIIGTSCSGFIRKHFKSLLNSRTIAATKKVIQSISSIVLSPPLAELKTGDVDFCDSYKKQMNSRQCHAEVSALSSLAKNGCLTSGVTVLFNINWTADPERKKMPCPQCHDLMQKVVSACKVNIQVCSESGVPIAITPGESNEKLQDKVMDGILNQGK